jgi:hypothetical protein
MPHGYEAGGDLPTTAPLDDDGDVERRRKKVGLLPRGRLLPLTRLLSSKNHSVGNNIFATRAVARIPQNGER